MREGGAKRAELTGRTRRQRERLYGECGSITELGATEKIDRSYLCRVLRLTLLAPEIVEAIIDAKQPEGGDSTGADETVSGGVGTPVHSAYNQGVGIGSRAPCHTTPFVTPRAVA